MQRHRLPDSASSIAARSGAMRVLVQAEQAHREAWRAEAALRAVAVDERALHRMQRAVGAAGTRR